MTDTPPVVVRDVMKSNPEMIDGMASAAEAIDRMRQQNFGSLIVERRDHHDEYGLITVREIAYNIIELDRSPERTNVYELMVKPVISVDVGMNLKYAIRLLHRYEEHRALVLENGVAVGIITLTDMVFHYTSTPRAIHDQTPEGQD